MTSPWISATTPIDPNWRMITPVTKVPAFPVEEVLFAFHADEFKTLEAWDDWRALLASDSAFTF